MKIRIAERTEFRADKMAKVALVATDRVQVDLYCLEAGQEQVPHAHADQDKVYVVLQGSARVVVDGATERLEAGEALPAPAGRVHGIANEGPQRLVALVVIAPPPRHG